MLRRNQEPVYSALLPHGLTYEQMLVLATAGRAKAPVAPKIVPPPPLVLAFLRITLSPIPEGDTMSDDSDSDLSA